MAIIYRTAGGWGAGKGSNLTPAEVDGNFYDLDGRLTTIEEDLPTGVGIANFSVSGTTFTVTMTDASVYGPFPLPVAMVSWAYEWEPATAYPELAVFYVEGNGLYLVTQAHTSEATFDPDYETTDGPVYQLLFGLPPLNAVTVYNTVQSDILLTAELAGYYIRVGDPDDTADNVIISVPDDEDIPVGAIYSLRRATALPVSVQGATDVTISTPETLNLRKNGSSATLIKVSATEWDLAGDLELDV